MLPLERLLHRMVTAQSLTSWCSVTAALWPGRRTLNVIYVLQAAFHSTRNTGWEPLRLLALYNPGGAEKALCGLPDFKQFGAGENAGWRVQ